MRRSILDDERVSRVRIWSTDGTLLFSTDPSDHPGSDEGLNDPVLLDASREGPLTRTDLSDGGGADDPERTLLRTYVPLGTASVAEIDQTDAGTVGPIRTAWFYYQLLAGGVLLLLLVMTAISLRDPIERINTGIPFAASSIPRGFSLIDDERLAAVQEVYRLASERVARLQEKLDESEEARRATRELHPTEAVTDRVRRRRSPRRLGRVRSFRHSSARHRADGRPCSGVRRRERGARRVGYGARRSPGPRFARPEAHSHGFASRSRSAEKPKRSPKRSKVKPEQQTSAPTEVSKTRPETAGAGGGGASRCDGVHCCARRRQRDLETGCDDEERTRWHPQVAPTLRCARLRACRRTRGGSGGRDVTTGIEETSAPSGDRTCDRPARPRPRTCDRPREGSRGRTTRFREGRNALEGARVCTQGRSGSRSPACRPTSLRDRRSEGACRGPRDLHPAHGERSPAPRHGSGRPGRDACRPGADRRSQEARWRPSPAARRAGGVPRRSAEGQGIAPRGRSTSPARPSVRRRGSAP